MLNLGHFSDAWKTAAVILILKPKKDPTQPENYRSISLLPFLSKITEKIIHNRLMQHLKNHDIIIHEQHGFIPNLYTSHQFIPSGEIHQNRILQRTKYWCGIPGYLKSL
ncbi:RNA-directed DNA polymerase from mobile element jockey [Nephila pilipes]|uniref:RNA-directed DNA polymerase from mobile element jockey n=1 Tax=Nephila pilipes TaxID=299642 RepID=A0A8X6QAQ9_NEPPI|nr:RNA-directed DNA polymerase from mobile element jockey [Nephila pilipes]